MIGTQKKVEEKELQTLFPIGSFIGIFMEKEEEQIFTFVRLIKHCSDSCESIYLYETINPKEFVYVLNKYGVIAKKEIYFKPLSDLFNATSVSDESIKSFRQLLKHLTRDSREKKPERLALRVILDTRWLYELFSKNIGEFSRFMDMAKELAMATNSVFLFMVESYKVSGSFQFQLMQYCNYHIIGGKLFEY